MSSYIFTIGYEDRANWQVCKQFRLLGVRSSPSAHASARTVKPGDTIFVWLGGGSRPGSGLVAKLRALGPATQSLPTPWPDPSQYTYKIPIFVEEELARPIPDSFPGHQLSARFGFQNTDLQKGLRPLSLEVVARMSTVFKDRIEDLPTHGAVVATKTGGWSTDVDLARRVEAAAVAAARHYLSEHGYIEVRDTQLEGCGFDFLYRLPRATPFPVEIKGSAGSNPRFVLTRLEHAVLASEASARLVLVLDALGHPSVNLLSWPDIQALGVVPDRYRVG